MLILFSINLVKLEIDPIIIYRRHNSVGTRSSASLSDILKP
jgi:hypothetical protein